MIEVIILAIIAATILFKINHPDITWGCMFGFHRFHSSGQKHGMYIDKKTNSIVGTKRVIYRCRCGKIKHAEDKDWIK